jgi:hypothetical protein
MKLAIRTQSFEFSPLFVRLLPFLGNVGCSFPVSAGARLQAFLIRPFRIKRERERESLLRSRQHSPTPIGVSHKRLPLVTTVVLYIIWHPEILSKK